MDNCTTEYNLLRAAAMDDVSLLSTLCDATSYDFDISFEALYYALLNLSKKAVKFLLRRFLFTRLQFFHCVALVLRNTPILSQEQDIPELFDLIIDCVGDLQ